MATPEYVRLANRLTNGLVVDMESGWSISGKDVQPYPERAAQATFVKSRLNRGILEPATAEEYEATHPDPDADLTDAERDAQQFVRMVEAAGKHVPVQERKVQEKLQREAEKVRQFREGAGDNGEELVKENKKRVQEQRTRGLSGDSSSEEEETKTAGGKQVKETKDSK